MRRLDVKQSCDCGWPIAQSIKGFCRGTCMQSGVSNTRFLAEQAAVAVGSHLMRIAMSLWASETRYADSHAVRVAELIPDHCRSLMVRVHEDRVAVGAFWSMLMSSFASFARDSPSLHVFGWENVQILWTHANRSMACLNVRMYLAFVQNNICPIA